MKVKKIVEFKTSTKLEKVTKMLDLINRARFSSSKVSLELSLDDLKKLTLSLKFDLENESKQ
jgi:hypothetical protein